MPELWWVPAIGPAARPLEGKLMTKFGNVLAVCAGCIGGGDRARPAGHRRTVLLMIGAFGLVGILL